MARIENKQYYSIKVPYILAVVAIVAFIAGVFLIYRNQGSTEKIGSAQLAVDSSPCVPAFADGGGPYYKPDSPMRSKIVPEENNGEKLIVSGKVLRKDCKTPVANAMLDIWQANETGNYQDEWYRGKVITDNEGNYMFETVVPKGYGEGTGYRPPHIHFKVFLNDTEVITSQIFFPEAKGRPGFEDAYIMKLESKEENGIKVHSGLHDIILP